MDQTNKDCMLEGMARAFFACAWADMAEECGVSLSGCEIMDEIPSNTDPAAVHAAATLYGDFAQAINPTGSEAGPHLTGAWIHIHGVDKMKTDSTEEDYELFGHYAAMQAMGHGVGLFDYDVLQSIVDKVPHVEFGSHSLQKDYFDATIDQGVELDSLTHISGDWYTVKNRRGEAVALAETKGLAEQIAELINTPDEVNTNAED